MLKLCRIHFEFCRSGKNGSPGSGMRKAIKADFEPESVDKTWNLELVPPRR